MDRPPESRDARERREIEADVKAVEILQRVRGMTEARAFALVTGYALGLEKDLNAGLRVDATGHGHLCLKVEALIKAYPPQQAVLDRLQADSRLARCPDGLPSVLDHATRAAARWPMLRVRLRDRQPAEALLTAPVWEGWLFSPRADFWVAAAGGGLLLIALALVLHWHGDRELSRADVLLGELHLGATYAAIVQRRLWRRIPIDVLAVPLFIVGATYLLLLDERALLVTTVVLYLGAWHRGRQGLGIARHYQRHAGGPVAPLHGWLLQAAFYLPMVAAVAYYTSTAPDHEGDAFYGLVLGPEILWALGGAAAAGLAAYLLWTMGRAGVHPGERSLVLAHALGFGSAYVLGAGTVSFVLVLAIHHEVQYLYFTYALARRAAPAAGPGWVGEARRLARFALWPAIGLASWVLCVWTELALLEPFLTAGLLAHYWLDGRIWSARARLLAAR